MDQAKLNVAKELLNFLQPNIKVGLGTGATVEVAMDLIFEQKLHTKLNLKFAFSSLRTQKLANDYNFTPLYSFTKLDLVFDGADCVLENGNLIKGLGGALFREKILAKLATKYIIIADEKKLRLNFDKESIPVEISSFQTDYILDELKKLGGVATIRLQNGENYKTDNYNLIADTVFDEIDNLHDLSTNLKVITGVVEHGLFLDFKPILILGSDTINTTKIIYT